MKPYFEERKKASYYTAKDSIEAKLDFRG